MAELQGYGRTESSSEVPVNTTNRADVMPKLVNPLLPGIHTGWPQKPAPDYSRDYETGPTGVKGDVE